MQTSSLAERAAGAVLAALVVLAPAAGAAPAPPPETIAVSATRCVGAWRAPNPGRAVFAVVDRTRVGGTVYLFHPVSGAIVTSSAVTAATTTRISVELHPGVYMWGCALRGMPVRSSESSTVPVDAIAGRATGTRIAPLTADQMVGPVRSYRRYVMDHLRSVAREVAALRAQLAGHRIAAARRAWLVAHVGWRQVGGAYDAFGDLGRAIDGTTAGLPRGAEDPRFTGFQRVERDLWHGRRVAADADARVLAADLDRLERAFATAPIAVNELPLRTHEILEDSLRDELTDTGADVSGTSLASVHGDVDATRELVGLLAPLLAPRAPGLVARARRELAVADAAIVATRHDGRWIPVAALSRRPRERVDAAVDAAVETLSAVPALLAIGRT